MRKLLLIISLTFFYFYSFSQENSRQNEIGLAFNNLDNFGLTFKTGMGTSAWRITTLLISGFNSEQNEDSLTYLRDNVGFGIGFGREYKVDIAENLQILLGADLSYSYSKTVYDNDDKSVNDDDRYKEFYQHEPAFNLVFGFNYILKEKLVIGAEIHPYISYLKVNTTEENPFINNGVETKDYVTTINYGLSNSSVLLTLSYRF
jgi:hypothetical protein